MDLVQDSEITIIDNFLNESYHQAILEIVESPYFPWYYQNNITETNSNEVTNNSNIGFNHWVNQSGEWQETKISNILMPFSLGIKDMISASSIVRVRLDMTTYNPSNYRHRPHIDDIIPHYASIYYVNDSDGETIIYNETFNGESYVDDKLLTVKSVIEPKLNRLLIFDGMYYHTGHSPSKNKTRILINSNYGK